MHVFLCTEIMLAVSPSMFGRPNLDQDMMIRNGEIMSFFAETEETSSDSFLRHSPTSFPKLGVREDDDDDDFNRSSPANGEEKAVKKLNHNASERDRRKRINDLYSSLRSLLPQSDQTKKLSIPGTVARVLKYIPELQKELESLQEKKEILLRKMAKQENSISGFEKHRKENNYVVRSLSVVSATRLSDKEIMIQISTTKSKRGSFAQLLWCLEQNGLFFLDLSCFESFQERVFYNLHLQVEGSEGIMDLEDLKEKISNSICEKQEEPTHLNFGSNLLVEALF